jgi:hypothetical protein
MEILKFIIEESNHDAFVEVSRDYNGIHVDHGVAKEEGFENRVVHGVHVALRALEIVEDSRFRELKLINRLDVVFKKPVFVDEELTLNVVHNEEDQNLKILVKVNEEDCIEMNVSLGDSMLKDVKALRYTKSAEHSEPLVYDCEERDLSMQLKSACDPEKLVSMFPSLGVALGYDRLSSIVMMSTIVGMYWPGQHSFFSGVQICFNSVAKSSIDFEVVSTDSRFRLTQMNVVSSGLEARIRAFFRPKRVKQPSFDSVKSTSKESEFVNQRALVIGGSKGLGEVVSKIIAGGGGKVTITYARDESAAERIRDDIVVGGGKCDVQMLRVEEDLCSEATNFGEYNAIYYFPSPRIFRRKVALYVDDLFLEFYDVYCRGFSALLKNVVKTGHQTVVYLPSSSAIDEDLDGVEEYRYAKILAEELLKSYGKRYNTIIRGVIERLPRLETEQTNSMIPGKSENIVEVMRKAVVSVNVSIE